MRRRGGDGAREESCARGNDGDGWLTNGTDDGACLTLAVDNTTKGESMRNTTFSEQESSLCLVERGRNAKGEGQSKVGGKAP